MNLEINIDKILTAIKQLKLRIQDRFPNAHLIEVCNDLETLADKGKTNSLKIKKPFIFFRISFFFILLVALFSIYYTFTHLKMDDSLNTFQNFITVTEALVNEFVLMGALIYFFYKLEDILKQRLILNALHELRTIAHIIDMHQLTKDPKYILSEKTLHSPNRDLNQAELNRYLDYCCEMLSLTAKVAAIYGNYNKDQVVLNTINDIEILTSTLSGKIWQKIGYNK